jgi:hypothetical protein
VSRLNFQARASTRFGSPAASPLQCYFAVSSLRFESAAPLRSGTLSAACIAHITRMHILSQLSDRVPQLRGTLKIQRLRSLLHLLLQVADNRHHLVDAIWASAFAVAPTV